MRRHGLSKGTHSGHVLRIRACRHARRIARVQSNTRAFESAASHADTAPIDNPRRSSYALLSLRVAARLRSWPPTFDRTKAADHKGGGHMRTNGKISGGACCWRRSPPSVVRNVATSRRRRPSESESPQSDAIARSRDGDRRRRIRRGREAGDHRPGVVRRWRGGISGRRTTAKRRRSSSGTPSKNPTTRGDISCSGCRRGRAAIPPKAEKAFEEALRIDPNHLKSLVNLSRVLIEQKRFDDAIDKLTHAGEIDPNSAEVHRLLGRAYHAQGKIEDAVMPIAARSSWTTRTPGR